MVSVPLQAADKHGGVGELKDGVLHVSATDADQLLNAGSEIIVLDVRTEQEHQAGKIKPGININYYADTFEADLAKLDKTKTYLVHCRSGVRSGRTLPIMQRLGFDNIIHLDGGIKAWWERQKE